MNVHWLDFTAIVAAPYLAIVLLMIRLHFRKDGSGNRKQAANAWEGKALIVAAVAIAVPMIFIGLALFKVTFPYGTAVIGTLGLMGLGWAAWQQRRAPPPPVASSTLSPRAQKAAAKRDQRRAQQLSNRRRVR